MRAAIEPIFIDPAAAPLLAGAEVPVDGEDDVAELPTEAVPEALVVARVLLPPVTGTDSLGTVTTEPEPETTGAVVVAEAAVTVGTEAAGVTWIWPSEYCETGARVEVAVFTVVVMLAQGVVAT